MRMARAIWKGTIKFGTTKVPVKLYSAVEDRTVHFRMLHRKDREPVKQQMVNPETGEIVPREKIRRGLEIDRGVYVMLDDDELKSLEPAASRDIEITRFVPPSQITHQWYDRPYFLGPDQDGAAYLGLVQALKRKEKEGVARWVMRKKEYIGALRVEGEYLTLITLRNAEEVVPASELPSPEGRALTDREVDLARQLIAALESDFDPTQYRDEYRDRVLELIETKAKGRRPKVRKLRPKKPPEKSLAEALTASLAATERKVA